ncbi:hypothetical protein HQ346_16655 [Rhodococcus sp. BP-252]|uniref:hypothetical protein n=1 Tax=unclassified Rhodococcus (in: high G+C Gram-positive bacteria) TaxID=192944 RepID=UPI001C9BA75B|nr:MULTISPECIES: hypothetical protein [unclassified Rhodococcus (in: high G+C Gram-positive bacteria)]MBY6413327.1 hypothetical protein [Rhodococcus sp. BP-320]MBY6418069.1 hypothetical protein [Rhodococcus sp. BP-321]MBY6422241.1 hypothetical protein [Rhodococcus sp. BP-324]MBY6428118.1 hypothetical protein [Rhodococcus sp. BP-323]MBY6433248.1 hypothetical protein [Rhodococcus sp. BP-322]
MNTLVGAIEVAWVLLTTGLLLLAAGLLVISSNRIARPYPVGNTLVVAGYVSGFAALLTSPPA